ncbi:MAG: hypothetical protein GXP47_10225 [Acidobacteria bacterium]|nr:hypothetical protein [Acidobacteriota bacterium]
MSATAKLLVHGEAMGRLDVANVATFLDAGGYASCEIFLRRQPHESVTRLLEEDGRVTVRTAADPTAEARVRLATLEARGLGARLERLDVASDRSFTRCPC